MSFICSGFLSWGYCHKNDLLRIRTVDHGFDDLFFNHRAFWPRHYFRKTLSGFWRCWSWTSLKNQALGSFLEFPMWASAFAGLSRHFTEVFVEGQVVANRVLPISRLHSVVRMASTDSLKRENKMFKNNFQRKLNISCFL